MINPGIRRKHMLKKPTKRRTSVKNFVGIDKNMNDTENADEQMINFSHDIKDNVEKMFWTSNGMDFYKSDTGFTYGDIYQKAGRDDRLVTFEFKEKTESYKKWPNGLTCVVQYLQEERKKLENDITLLNSKKIAKCQYLLKPEKPIYDVNLSEIISMVIAPVIETGNKFYTRELRNVKVLNVPFKVKDGGRDIYWMYGALKRYLSNGIAITPEEYNQYLAYKMILEYNELTDDERTKIFDVDGVVNNIDVGRHYFAWKNEAGLATEVDKAKLSSILREVYKKRIVLLEEELSKIGTNILKLKNDYPEKLELLLSLCCKFHEKRFNKTGKHLLYIDFKGILHVYLRHVKELQLPDGAFKDKDKFQLHEKDIMQVMDIILHRMNDEYQIWKGKNPNKRYHWYGPRTYHNGDYYEVYVNENGSIGSFYKGCQSRIL